MTLLLLWLIVYSLGLIAIGIWAGRHVRGSTDFFVGRQSLGAGLLFSTFLAANIGAGSTVGATGYAYTDGLAAWWWNGSAGLGSLILAFWIGPRVWREAHGRGLLTVGDLLEHHFGSGVRRLAATIIWLGSLAILCAQLKGAAEVLVRISGLSLGAGALLSAIAMTAYFVAGGLLSAARVNVVQLIVILAGFLLAAWIAPQALAQPLTSAGTGFWRGPHVGWPTLFLLAPAFFLSPGLVQKAFGARDARAVRVGVGLNGLALMAFAWLPVILGLVARTLHPGLARPDQALPAVLAANVPGLIGALALTAVFSAEISSADAVLFMLSTSGAQDFYRAIFRPQASDADVLRVARLLAVASGLIGFALTFVFDSVVSALTVFYSMMVVTLFAPLMGALFLPRAGRWAALAAMLVGVTTLFATTILTAGAGYGWATPPFLGLVTSSLTYFVLAVL